MCLIIKGGKLSAKVLAKAMKIFLDKSKKIQKKITAPVNYRGKGKQTVKQLVGQGVGVSNIEINDKNIKSFESIAKKYGIDFAIMKDKMETPPKWLVFFKGRDTDAITAAFREFSAKQLSKATAKPSLLQNMRDIMEKVKNQIREITKNKDRGHEL